MWVRSNAGVKNNTGNDSGPQYNQLNGLSGTTLLTSKTPSCGYRPDLGSGYTVNPIICAALVIIRGHPWLNRINSLKAGTGGVDATGVCAVDVVFLVLAKPPPAQLVVKAPVRMRKFSAGGSCSQHDGASLKSQPRTAWKVD